MARPSPAMPGASDGPNWLPRALDNDIRLCAQPSGSWPLPMPPGCWWRGWRPD